MNTQLIAMNLVRLRRDQSWTQDELAEKLHISRQAISKWETGASIPSLEVLIELSKLYKVTINEIVDPPNCKRISDFEEIVCVDPSELRTALSLFSPQEIVTAALGASPESHELMERLFDGIDFAKEKTAIGRIRITVIEVVQNRIVDAINHQLGRQE